MGQGGVTDAKEGVKEGSRDGNRRISAGSIRGQGGARTGR